MPDKTPTYSARTAEEYLRTRVDFKTEGYRKKGMRYRWGYLMTVSIVAICSAAVPVLINLQNMTLLSTALSLLVTILVSIEGIFHMREHWKNYDLMKSYLRQESCLFQAGASVYRDKTPRDAFILLVERVEDAISKERSQTIQMRTARSSEPEHQPAKSDGDKTKEASGESRGTGESGTADAQPKDESKTP